MVMDRARAGLAVEIKQPKRADLVAEEIKRLITEKDLSRATACRAKPSCSSSMQ